MLQIHDPQMAVGQFCPVLDENRYVGDHFFHICPFSPNKLFFQASFGMKWDIGKSFFYLCPFLQTNCFFMCSCYTIGLVMPWDLGHTFSSVPQARCFQSFVTYLRIFLMLNGSICSPAAPSFPLPSEYQSAPENRR